MAELFGAPSGQALVIGASRGIGLEFVRQLLGMPQVERVYAACRRPEQARELQQLGVDDRLVMLPMDVTAEPSITAAMEQIKAQTAQLNFVVNCAGVLHDGALQPEKSLRQIDADRLLQYFQVNSIGGILVAKHLLPFFKHDRPSLFATISAKVGSISDNQLGGWYGYRASKAALNMFLKTASIEYKRSSPKTIIMMLHPGTTDTQLSEPFQKMVPPEKLFSTERTVRQLLEVLSQRSTQDSGEFFAWNGDRLPW